MTPDVIAIVALALLGALKLRYDDRADRRKHDAAKARAAAKGGQP